MIQWMLGFTILLIFYESWDIPRINHQPTDQPLPEWSPEGDTCWDVIHLPGGHKNFPHLDILASPAVTLTNCWTQAVCSLPLWRSNWCVLYFWRFVKWSRWWFHIFFMFTPIWGEILILTSILQMGWNHQPVIEMMQIFLSWGIISEWLLYARWLNLVVYYLH